MTARPHTILKTLKRESNNQLCLALDESTTVFGVNSLPDSTGMHHDEDGNSSDVGSESDSGNKQSL